MLNHSDKEDSLPRNVSTSKPQMYVEKSPPKLIDLSSNPNTPAKGVVDASTVAPPPAPPPQSTPPSQLPSSTGQ